MASPTPSIATNPNHTKPKTTYHIGGIQVEFPYQPYGTQLAFMGRVISTLDRAQRDGHCHALLESPTGTGKSLSLLCSTLAWQQNCKLKNQYAYLTHSKPNPEATTDPLAYGGGFIPETQPSVNVEEPVPAGAGGKSQKKKVAPTIYYASRTHSQISQVIREYRKTGHRVAMAVLASRKHYCTNGLVKGKENIDEECKLLLRDRQVGCSQFKNANKIRNHPSLQKGGCHEVHDIEDLVKVGKIVQGCPYYAARSMADDAILVFCPYSYIINPVIRGAMEVDIKGAILILDEAHNIEDISRDAGSVDIEEDGLQKLQMELGQLCAVNTMIYQPLYEMVQDLISWIERRKNTLEKRDFQHYFSCWTGDKALRELQEANISQQCFPILLECATKAIKAASDTESEEAHLSGMSVVILEGLFSSLTFFFSRNGCYTSDFQLALQRCVRRDKRNAVDDWTHTFSLWCLNPAVVFRDIADLSLSVILTSGTLSPMNSFSSELGVQFGTCLEAPHVIDVELQVWAGVISCGPDNYPLNASYKTADAYAFQDSLGKSLEEICKIVPAGSLVFFPSYKLMEKLCNRWRETGQWFRLNARKPLFVEPRGGSQEDFDSILKDYYSLISRGNKPAVQRKRRVKKVDRSHLETSELAEDTKKGAAFLAVCRGKVSEGIDFSDDNARVVILVGIPFPNINDILVGLKKKYNDTYKTSKNLVSGNEWYCNQAFRALNQAAGRCIRHRFDYGAVILLDERFQEERNRIYISKWLRKSIRQYDNFNQTMKELKLFFRYAKENNCKTTVDLVSTFEADEKKDTLLENQSQRGTGNKRQKSKKSDRYERKVVSLVKCDAVSPKLKSEGEVAVQASIDVDIDCHKEDIVIECESPKDTRFCRYSDAYSHEDPEITIIKETPGVDCNGTTASPGVISKDGNSCSTVIQAPLEFTDQASFCSVSVTNPSSTPYKAQCSMVLTPEKEVTLNTRNLIPEAEPSLDMSVNSHAQKRWKSSHFPLFNLIEDQSDVPSTQTLGSTSFTSSSMASRDANRRIEFGSEMNHQEWRCTTLDSSQLLPMYTCAPLGVSGDTVMDKRLRISCSFCKNPLGLPENHLFVRCSLTSLSKIHLASLVKERLEESREKTSTCIPVLVTDVVSVDQRLCNSPNGHVPRGGIWCEEDGCVFNSLFCPFCSTSNCLGVQVMAVDASNIQLLNKILFYVDRLEIENLTASNTKQPKDMDFNSSCMDKVEVFKSIDKFSYSPQHNTGGWRTTKSKLRLPKRPAC